MRVTASKAVALLFTSIPAWGLAASSGGYTAKEWWILVGILSQAALVFTVPNVPKTWNPPTRRDGGQAYIYLLAAVGFLCVLWLLLGHLNRY